MISIIVPVYNVKLYLEECVKSILKQKYSNFECILIDDGSTDGSATICDSLAKLDDRIKVVHQKNTGVSSARNRGIEMAQGEWISFVDSDDWIGDDYLSNMFVDKKEEAADLIITGVEQVFANGNSIALVPNHIDSLHLNHISLDEFVDLNRKYLLYGPVAKLYRTSIINNHNIRFDKSISYGEDLLFNYAYLDKAETVSSKDKCSYYYRKIESDTLSTKLRPDQFLTDYKQWLVLKEFYVKHSIWEGVAKEYLYQRLWGIIYDGLFLYLKLDKADKNYINQILSIPEISELRNYGYVFICSNWIKLCIEFRMSYFLFFYFHYCKRRRFL